MLLALLALIAVFCYVNGFLWRRLLPRFRDSRRVYLVSMFPGTVLHELCHAVMSLLLFVPVRRISLFTPGGGQEGGKATLGQVETVGGGPIRLGIISMAPFVGGLGVMFVLLYFLGGVSPSVGSLQELPQALRGFWASPWVLPLLLLCWVLSLGVLPSGTDIKNALFFLLILVGLIALTVYVLTRFEGVNNTEAATAWLWTANGYLVMLFVFLLFTAVVLAVLVPVPPRQHRRRIRLGLDR